jgi:hypothetical protein
MWVKCHLVSFRLLELLVSVTRVEVSTTEETLQSLCILGKQENITQLGLQGARRSDYDVVHVENSFFCMLLRYLVYLTCVLVKT